MSSRFCRLSASLLGFAALVACGDSRVQEPLFGPLNRPLVLSESEQIHDPVSDRPNRLMGGWRDVARRGPMRLSARAGAAVQGVHLGSTGRVLRFAGRADLPDNSRLEAQIDGGDWFPLAPGPDVRIPLPDAIPLGRFHVRLRFPEGASVRVTKATFSQALPAGEARVEASSLVQSGYSLVETVRRLSSDASLTGSFRPPTEATDGQRFSIGLQWSGGLEATVFEWRPGARSAGSFTIPIEADDGWIRIRFLAEGEGPPARWSGLAFHQRGHAEPPATAPPAPPRVVILYVMDALRSDFVGHLGGTPGLTPTIDRLAAEGASFRSHFSSAPNTVPSMKSLLTGQVFLLKGGMGLDPEGGLTLAERFVGAGYRTALFSGNGNVSHWRGLGRGYQLVAPETLWKGRNHVAEVGYNNNAEVVHRSALDWIGNQDPEDRLFLHLQTIHPHNPYAPPEPFLSRFVDATPSEIDGRTETLLAIQRRQRDVTEADERRLRALYAGGAAYNDHHLKGFLDAVLERYRREEVLLVVTSDHGEELFEHGGVLHGYTLYDEMLRIPLVVWWPGTVVPVEVPVLTDTLDVFASLASLAAQGAPFSGGGRELWSYLTGARRPSLDDREVIFSAASAVRGGIFMARTPWHKLILAPRGGSRGAHAWGMGQGRGRSYDPEYFFDLVDDPGELENLIGTDSLRADWLRARLAAWIEAGVAIESGAALEALDAGTEESLRALGYVQ